MGGDLKHRPEAKMDANVFAVEMPKIEDEEFVCSTKAS